MSSYSSWLDVKEYPFAHRQLRLSSGAAMHYVDEGDGEPILFVHGTPTWSFEWRHLINRFKSTNRCVAPDLIGMGLSDRPRSFTYTPEAHSAALAEFVQRLGLRDFTLVVHDYGGPIGLPLAFDASVSVKRVVLINTWGWSFADDSEMRSRAKVASSALSRFLYRHLNFSQNVIMPSAYGDRKKLTPAIHAQYKSVFPDADSRGLVLYPFAKALLGSSAFYESITARLNALRNVPVLVVWGVKDSAFRPHQLQRWRNELPNAQIVELDAGHWPHEELPNEVGDAIARFLASTGA